MHDLFEVAAFARPRRFDPAHKENGRTPLSLTLDFCSNQTLGPNEQCDVRASTGGDGTGATSCSVAVSGSVTNFRGTLEWRDVNNATLVQEPLR
jgi:hypothetical protein